jgi:hypothetical protein
MYQPTSWEYIQFLALANDGTNAFLGQEGNIMLDAWLNAQMPDGNVMAEPVVMASVTWGAPTTGCEVEAPVLNSAVAGDKEVTVNWSEVPDASVTGYVLYYDQSGKAQEIATVACASASCSYTDTGLTNGQQYCYKVTAESAVCESLFSDIACATPQPPGQQSLAGVGEMVSGWYRMGKGRNATLEWRLTDQFFQGDDIVIRARVTDQQGTPLSNAKIDFAIRGPENVDLVSGNSDADGYAEATWSTAKANKRGVGGTAVGAYTATVSGLSISNHSWDGVGTQITFDINPR